MILISDVKHFDNDYKEISNGAYKLRRLSRPEANDLKKSVETAWNNKPEGKKNILKT